MRKQKAIKLKSQQQQQKQKQANKWGGIATVPF